MGLFDSSDSGNNDPSQSFWGDPSNQAAFGAIAGILQAGTTPRFAPNGWGIKGGGPLNALAALTGAGMAGAVGGADNAQLYQKAALENQNAGVMNPIAQQTAALGLQKQQALQPMQISMIQKYMNGEQGGNTAAPFGMPNVSGGSGGQLTPGQQILSQANPSKLTESDGHFSQALDAAMAMGDLTQFSKVQQSWAEHSPELAGAIKNAQEQNTIVALPGGRQVPGSQIMPAYGSMSPSMGEAPYSMPQGSIPSPPPPSAFNNVQPQIPAQPVPASQLFAPSSAGINQNDPVAVAAATKAAEAQAEANVKVATAGPVKAAEDQGANLADAEKAYSVMQSQFPMLQQRIQDMTEANKLSSFGPPKLASGTLGKVTAPISSMMNNDPDGNGPITAYHASQNDPINDANVRLQQAASQGILPEMSTMMSNQNLKGNKYIEGIVANAGGLNLTTSQNGRQTQINGLAKQYVQSMVSAHDMIADRGGAPQPLPPEVVRAAVQYGVMSHKDAHQYLIANHASMFTGAQ